ncbi:hypothetical protein PMIN05_009096 [Paraphaeosphaeria minitans]
MHKAAIRHIPNMGMLHTYTSHKQRASLHRQSTYMSIPKQDSRKTRPSGAAPLSNPSLHHMHSAYYPGPPQIPVPQFPHILNCRAPRICGLSLPPKRISLPEDRPRKFRHRRARRKKKKANVR